ncbi:hypothetical protein [Adhaeribacter pallidiroseus]|nr:hypothetical protein [Adhaeribacter pallidiroseus]
MQVKRYLDKTKANKLGMAPIYLVVHWDGNRTKLFPNEKTHVDA